MEEKLKRIEEKLDVLLAAMSANPEFTNFVKEGQLRLHLEKFKKDLQRKASERRSTKRQSILDNLQRHSIKTALIGVSRTHDEFGFAPDPGCPEFARELIDAAAAELGAAGWNYNRWSFDEFAQAVLDKEGFCSLTKYELNAHFGDDIKVEVELEKERLRYSEENK